MKVLVDTSVWSLPLVADILPITLHGRPAL